MAFAGGPVVRDVPPGILTAPIDEVIERRRSTRRFRPGPIERSDLEAVLTAGTAPIPGDSFAPSPTSPFLLVNAVDGLEPGVYAADGVDLRQIRPGDPRQLAGALALGQDLAADAAVNIYFLSDLDEVLGRLGERGYRVAQMAGGIPRCARRARGDGARPRRDRPDVLRRRGDEVFEPAAAGRQVMYLAAVGQRQASGARP